MYNRGLFHTWVPKPMQLLLIIILTIPMLTTNGIYAANMGDMVGGLGILSEDLLMANNAATIGMIVVFPIIIRVKQAFKSKHILLATFFIFLLASYICSTTENPSVLIAANFVMGAFKMFGMIELILPIVYILSPTGDRGKFYSVFYAASIGLSSLSGAFASSLSYNASWQYVYAFAIPFLLFCTLLVLIFSHNSYADKPMPLYQFDWLSLFIYSGFLMLLNFVLTYGRMLNWLDSVYIQGALILSLLIFLWFIQRQMVLKRPYLSLPVYKKKNVYSALFFIFMMGFFLSTASIQSTFTTGILKYSAQVNANLNLMMVPGAIVAGIFCLIWLRRKKGIKGLVFVGFSALIMYHVIFYFLFSPVIEIHYLLLPIFFKGFGMTVLYISIGVYAAEKLSLMELMSSAGMLILFRSFVGTAFWGAVFSTQLYAGQLNHTAAIVQRMDANDPFYTARANPIIQGAMAQGNSVEAAQSLATQSMWGGVQVQATLSAAKMLFGYTILTGFLVLFLVAIHRFGPVNLRRLAKIRRRFRQKEIIKTEEEMMAAIAP